MRRAILPDGLPEVREAGTAWTESDPFSRIYVCTVVIPQSDLVADLTLLPMPRPHRGDRVRKPGCDIDNGTDHCDHGQPDQHVENLSHDSRLLV
jgi:hypothetical protein